MSQIERQLKTERQALRTINDQISFLTEKREQQAKVVAGLEHQMAEPSLIERLLKRAKQDRDCATNSAVVVDLLAPEMAKFEARTGHNIYAVRMAVDHKNSVKRDNAFADDLEAAASTLEDQARLIGECRRVLKALLRSFDDRQLNPAFTPHPSIADADALLTKLNAFGERDESNGPAQSLHGG